MDYRALAELVMLSLMGLSVLTFAVGLSLRLFIAPTLRELFGRRSASSDEQRLLGERLARIEERLDGIESGVDRLTAATDFDRQLEGPKLG